MPKAYADMFLADIGHSWRIEDDVCVGSLVAVPELCVPGTDTIRPSVLAAAADVVAGVLANHTIAPRIPLTADLSYRTVGPAGPGSIEMVARTLKVGRTTVVGEVLFTAGHQGVAVGISHATFIASPRPGDVMEEMHRERASAPASLAAPIADQLGCVELAPGTVELARRDYVLQPAGTIQGGAVALLAEVAAAGLAGAVVTELEVRYLTAVRAGPARTTSSHLGAHGVRVEIRDVGNDDRLAAVAVARVER